MTSASEAQSAIFGRTSAQDLLRIMLAAREADRRESILHRQSQGWFQLPSSGHEALAVLCASLEPDDYLFPYYRDRALLLARGVSNYDLALGYFAKGASSSGGRQMTSHFSSRSHNVFSCASPTALHCLPAAGAAWACKMQARSQVTVCCLGDASLRQGEFYEALCFSVERQLPIVFVIEDNGFGITTRTDSLNPFSLGVLSTTGVHRVDGRDPFAIHQLAETLIEAAREGLGPAVIWASVDRPNSHSSSDDQRAYRSEAELQTISERDPLTRFANDLILSGVLSVADWNRMKVDVSCEVDRDYTRAMSSPDPDSTRLLEDVLSTQPQPLVSVELCDDDCTIVSAVNRTLDSLLESDSRIVMFGEDIEDPCGGVFRMTRGLSSHHPGRVSNAPLAEATILGVGCGLAAVGYRPIFELQFIDFVGPAFNQLVNQISTLRWRTSGEWSCPLTILAPYGAYFAGGGPWHSQSNESFLAHSPGLRIAVPSSPQDCAAVLKSAVQGNDPTLILLPKRLFRKRMPPQLSRHRSAGVAEVIRKGEDITIVAWGNCVELALLAAEEVVKQGIDVEVVDLKWIVPWDRSTVAGSVKKTGRVIVVQEDSETCSFGQAVIAKVSCDESLSSCLKSSPRLVTRPDVHIGYNPLLQAAALPSVSNIAAAIRDACIQLDRGNATERDSKDSAFRGACA